MKNVKRWWMAFVCQGVVLSALAGGGRLYTADQLSSSMIDFITQDAYGYIWVGTQYGLNKFDGYRFTHFFTDRKDSTTLPDNDVSRIFVDSRHRLWTGGAKGLGRYDYDRNRFVRYAFPGGITPRIECLYEDCDGNLLIGTSGYGLFSIRDGKDVVGGERQFSRRKDNDFITVIFEDGQHNLWRGSQNDTITRLKVSSLHPTASKDFVSPYGPVVKFLKTDNRGFLAVCMYGVLRYDYATGQLVDAGIDMSALENKVSIRAALIDHAGELYLGTSGQGLFVVPLGSHSLRRVESGRDNYDLSTANINHLFEDKDHNIWVSCYKKGLFLLSQGDDAFLTWKFASQNYVLGSSLSSIAPGDNGSVWCTVQKNGVYRFDADGLIHPAPASPAAANCIYRDKQGQYWVGSENMLYNYNPLTGASTPRLQLDGWGINCMTDDGEGNLYVCNYGKGLCIYRSATGQSIRLTMYQVDSQRGGLCNDWVKALLIDSRGLLWIATSNGVCVMNPEDLNFRIFGWGLQLKGMQCFSLCEQKEGAILIGTESGLYRYNRDTNKVELFPHSEEMENRPVYTIVCSNDGDLWMSSANGIWQYDNRNQRIVSHVKGNGLDTREFILGAAIHRADDRIVYGSNEGLVAFYPKNVGGGGVGADSNVFLTNFIIDGKSVSCLADNYEIPYDQNSFAMEFSMLNFRNAENISYEYRLNGGDWMPFSDGSNGISFNRMKPGKYVFEVRALPNGIHHSGVCTITVVVNSPWYASTVAYCCYALLLFAVAMLLFYYLERRRKAELDEQKMRFLINATHDIRSPLTLIMGPLNKLKERLTDQESLDDINIIDRNAQRLLLLVNQILDERKIDKNQMHLHCAETDLVGFVAGICSLFQYNARQRNIRFTFEHDESELKAWIDRIQFDKVVSNLLSNAFKYTFDGGEVKVVLGHDDKDVVIKVVDSGIGFKEEKTERLFERFYQGKGASDLHIEGTGIGLNLSRAIVQMHGGRIRAFNRDDGQRGACLDVRIPLGNVHLKPEEIEQEDTDERLGARQQASRNFRLLVVDDDFEVAQYIKNELGSWYKIELAPNGREALKMLLTDNNSFDLVVSDVMMPEMDGIAMLKQIKGNPNISDIPVILLTSKAEVDDRLEGLRKGADAYLAKPFSMEELHILIDNLVDNVRRLRGKYSGAQQQQDKLENVEVKGNNEALMERVMRTVNANLQDPDFSVDKLSEEVGLSRTQLHRKMKEITGISTGEFIRNLRLQQAVRLIREGKVNIAQVAYSVGFNNHTYFSTVFKKYFGKTPTEYSEDSRN